MPKRVVSTEVDPDEAAVFRAAVGTVQPVRKGATATLRAPPLRRRRKDAPLATLEANVPSEEPAVEPEEFLAFHRPGVRDTMLRRLKRGQLGIEAKLDLHGENLSAARQMVDEFLLESQTFGRRCLLIVHGKGYRSAQRGPVLKAAVNAWLRRESAVLAFVSARPVHGGAGAVYVLLRA